MRFPHRMLSLATLTFLILSSISWAQIAPPAAAVVEDVADTYFGTKIVDPYRWMENEKDPRLANYLKSQGDYTRSRLDAIPGRDKLFRRLMELDQAGTQVSSVQHWAGKYFYYKTEPRAENRKLYVREGLNGAERALIDPEKMSTQKAHYSIDFFQPSFDGKYVAYGLSEGGSEQAVIHVVETATARVLPDSIDRCLYSYAQWAPDNTSFFYMRLNQLPPDAPSSTRLKKTRAYLHKLGANPDQDPAVFGYGVNKDVEFGEDDFPIVGYTLGSDYLFAIVAHGVQNEATIYLAPVKSLAAAATPWKKAVDTKDDVTSMDMHGNDLFLLTHKDAPRYKIVKTSLQAPDFAKAQVVVPAGKTVITSISAAQDGLYYKEMDGGISRVKRIAYNGRMGAVPSPFEGAVLAMFTSPVEDGALVELTGWTRSPVWLAYDSKTNQSTDTKLVPPSPVDFSAIESKEVEVKSADGAMVPLSIIYKRGLAMDGSHPTLLMGYGAYGISMEPYFLPTSLAWLERGGVGAIAHVRGGGEYGEDWHLAGQKATKMNTIGDFIACAQYLIDQKYTSPAKLAGTGTSAGGILIGGAITKRPDLFAAAISRVGVSNALRFEVSQGGPANVPEFGTVANEQGFKALYEMDAYQHVKPNTPYPAVLLTTGMNDPRVPVWQVAKMTARLQAATSSGKPVLLRIDSDAGHGNIDATKSQKNAETADQYTFLLWQFGDPEFQPKKP